MAKSILKESSRHSSNFTSMSCLCYKHSIRPSVCPSVTSLNYDHTVQKSVNQHDRIGYCKQKLTQTIVSCDPEFCRKRPTGYGKMSSFALWRHVSNDSHMLHYLIMCSASCLSANVTHSRLTKSGDRVPRYVADPHFYSDWTQTR